MQLLIIGDLKGHMIEAAKIAKEKKAKVLHAIDTTSAMIILRSGKNVEMIMMDAEMNVGELKNKLENERFFVPIVACGVLGDHKRVVESIKEGAIEYVPLPPNKEVIASLFSIISNHINKNEEIIALSPSFSKVISLAKQIAPSTASVLISGKSGVGKEVIAKFIHNNSDRADKELISINCAAIPENLLESEMFGHEKGAFTGAIERRIGKFEQANYSTLFLDEISEMDLKLQAKLLRAIQEKEILRVGGNKTIELNIRIIATSNRNLMLEVKRGHFREDLFHRLNVVHIKVPPLSERTEDIKPLADYFLKKYCEVNNMETKIISDDAVAKLKFHKWPGNVRELENTIHRTILMTQSKEIKEESIPFFESDKEDNENEEIEALETVEKKTIKKALDKYNKNYDLIARVLGISINTLYDKLKQHYGSIPQK